MAVERLISGMGEVDWDRLHTMGVMIVDDSRTFRQLVTTLLCHVGFKNIYCAGGWSEALDLYRSKEIGMVCLILKCLKRAVSRH